MGDFVLDRRIEFLFEALTTVKPRDLKAKIDEFRKNGMNPTKIIIPRQSFYGLPIEFGEAPVGAVFIKCENNTGTDEGSPSA